MVTIPKGTGTTDLIFTLNERKTLAAPDYRFEFTNTTTKENVTITMTNGADLSEYPERFNEFSFNRSSFDNVDAGQYQYIVYEVTTEVVLEVGKMLLQPVTGNTILGYAQTTTITGYAG
jgi:hypothetical protein